MLKSLSLQKLHNSQCIYTGTLLPGHPPIYIDLYVDNFIYFSSSPKVEKQFELKFNEQITTTFQGPVTHFLGLSFQCYTHPNNHICIKINQEPFIDTLLQKTNLHLPLVKPTSTPYQLGYPVDKIPSPKTPHKDQTALTLQLQQLTGCLQWLSVIV